MTLGNNDKRTSAQQVLWVWNKISGFFKGLFSHIRRCRGVYSFLLGALSTLLFLWAFIWYGILAYPVPWKVIDPTDSRFDVTKFRLTDYQGSVPTYIVKAALFPSSLEDTIEYISEFEENPSDRRRKAVSLRESLQTLLPIGSNKTEVDTILVSYGGAVSREVYNKHPSIKEKNYKEYSYSLLPFFSYIKSMLYGYPPDEFDIQIFVVYDTDSKILTASFHENFNTFFEKQQTSRMR